MTHSGSFCSEERNEPCLCDSGKKYHGKLLTVEQRQRFTKLKKLFLTGR